MSIGFLIALAIVVTAFEWRTAYEPPIAWEEIEHPIPLLGEVITVDVPEPPKPKVVMPLVTPAPDDTPVEDVKKVIDPEEVIETLDLGLLEEPLPVEIVPEIVDYADKMPVPAGGLEEFMAYLAKNIRYPRSGIVREIQGTVFVQFVVDEQGRLTDMKVLKGLGDDFDAESVRVLSSAPAWLPGSQGGRPVKVRMVLPIVYRLK